MLTIAQCDGLPSGYEKTLCRFETVHIHQIMTDTAPSAVPVIKIVNFPSFITEEEMISISATAQRYEDSFEIL